MATPQYPSYSISSFPPSGQMYNPAGEGPSAPSQGAGQYYGAGNTPRSQGPEPRYNRGHNKWNASAPARPPARTWGRDRRQYAYPPRQNNSNYHYRDGPGQGYHHPNSYNNRNPPNSDGSYQPRGHGHQNQPDHPNHHNHRYPPNSSGSYQPRESGPEYHNNNRHNNNNNNRYYNRNNGNNFRGNNNRRNPPRSNQGIFGRRNPRPVRRTGLDYDNDSTMSGMPRPYNREQWHRIQHMRHLRENQQFDTLRAMEQQPLGVTECLYPPVKGYVPDGYMSEDSATEGDVTEDSMEFEYMARRYSDDDMMHVPEDF
ncbi:hypothetical protein BDW62DRAFT_202535 [Aspergillus aurantiobrunneus]